MQEFFRRRRALWPVVGIVVGLILAGWDLAVAAPTFVREYQVRNDFRLTYAAATVGVHDGYGRLYDLSAQKAAILGIGPGFNPQPFISPPPLAWLVTPLLLLPFQAALVVWTLLLLAALVWTWFLLAPPGRVTRVAHLLLLIGVFPVAFGLMVGQPGALVAAAVATSWWLIAHDRPGWAGVALSFLIIKPQLAILVPVCLLMAGHARTFGAWLIATFFIGMIALVLLGHDGLDRYREVLAQTQTAAWDITRRYSISGPLGLGPVLNLAQLVVVGVALLAAWRHGREGPEIPIAAGIAGSLLATPYLGFQDFVMLVVAGWLVLHAGASTWQVVLMVVGYALLEMVIVVLAIPILLAEVAFLVSFLWPAPVRLPRSTPPSGLPARAPA